MSDNKITTVTLNILDRPYQIRCPKNKMEDLQRAAFTLDDRMREIKATSNLKSLDHVILMAALNITNELHLCQKHLQKSGPELTNKIQYIQQKLNNAITANSENINV